MTTAEALEGMTDEGEFEILATRALRNLEPDCKALIHMGVNAAGKPVRGPNDAFCRVPGSQPSLYVTAAFTTTNTKDLSRKWLSDDGDIARALRQVESIRRQEPNSRFLLYLCTNRTLNVELQNAAIQRGNQASVEVRFLEQSRLRDHLDQDPEGQWLRQEHLKIEAEQVSRPLLMQLSGKSLNEYASQLLLLAPHEMVPTAALRRARKATSRPIAVCLLVGHSGAGKSVIGHEMLREQISHARLALWISGHIAERASALAEAIETAIRSFQPRVQVGSGHSVLGLATTEDPLLIVVDDINRTTQPTRLLEKLMGWARSKWEKAKDGETGSQIRIVCPVWNTYWDSLKVPYSREGWVSVEVVDRMERAEAVACLTIGLGKLPPGFTEHTLDDIADRLQDDPILLGLFCYLLPGNTTANPFELAENVVGEFVQWALRNVLTTDASAAEYIFALNRLASFMIQHKRLYPARRSCANGFMMTRVGVNSYFDSLLKATFADLLHAMTNYISSFGMIGFSSFSCQRRLAIF
jgi:hypothetical protein